jgi:multiple sugar transport system ATP-binding protein
LFLFDEPLSNLDAKLRVELRGEIKRLHERIGASIVYVTHDQIEAMTLGTKVVVLNGGVIQQIGTPEEIYRRPVNRFVADFMGSPPMNLVPAELDWVDGRADLTFHGGQRLSLPGMPPALAIYDKRSILLGVRPETLTLGNSLSGPVHLVENSGSDTFVTFKLGPTPLIARLPGRVAIAPHTQIGIDLDPTQVSFFDAETGRAIG